MYRKLWSREEAFVSKFKKHTPVYLPRIKKYGTVVGLAKPGVWDVAVGTLVVQCREAELKAVAESPKQPKDILIDGKTKPRRGFSPTTRKAAQRLDLHGMRVEEAMKETEKAIDRAILADVDRLEIVHGVGTGKIREALHKYLKGLSVVENFKMDDVNPGVTWVYF
jgi:DNA mismatch repair protein MutS2